MRWKAFKYFRDDKNAQVKIDKIQEIKRARTEEAVTSCYRMQEQCNLIPDSIAEHHGYHWNCYKRFTGNLDRLAQSPSTSSSLTANQRSSRRSSTDKDQVLFKPDCIFCNSEGKKAVKVKGAWTTQGLTGFTSDAWQSIPEIAKEKNDEKLLVRIRDCDLFACEAKFHRKCLIDYMQVPEKWRSGDQNACATQSSLVEAHQRAFDVLCITVENDILQQNKVVKLSSLQRVYVSVLGETEHSNTDYRNENLKSKLIKRFGDQLVFCEMSSSGRYQSSIIFSSALDVKSAVKQAFILGSNDNVENVGMALHHVIEQAHEDSPELKWPPVPEDLGNFDMPDALAKLLSFVICGHEKPCTQRVQRLVNSIGQDICRAATNGKWKLPKHIDLVMSLRHLFRSKSLINLIYRMGHCESYDFSLELETALAEAVELSSSLLSMQIVKNPSPPTVFHSEFDNFDKLLNDLSGKGSIHTAHGIMLQEAVVGMNDPQGKVELPAIPRTKKRSLNLTTQDTLPECYVSLRQSPRLQIFQLFHPGGPDAIDASLKLQILWMFLRTQTISQQEPIPSWAGFISSTGVPPQHLTTIDYYPVINHPITDYKTVQECLRISEEATNEVGQQYVINSFDLGVCMKAFPIIWQNPDRYKDHIILIGTFHLECAFMKMLGKKMKGSGLEDILLEAGLIGGGSVAGVMQGKHYDRAIHCHKVMLEALEGLLLEKFMQTEGHPLSSLSPAARAKVDTLLQTPTPTSLDDVLCDSEITAVIQKFVDFRHTDMGKTAKLWLSYMDHVHLLLALIESGVRVI